MEHLSAHCVYHLAIIVPEQRGTAQIGHFAMKWWLLFIFDLSVALCAVRAIYLIFSTGKARAESGQIASEWNSIWEASGWLSAGCLAGLAAFLAVVIPG